MIVKFILFTVYLSYHLFLKVSLAKSIPKLFSTSLYKIFWFSLLNVSIILTCELSYTLLYKLFWAFVIITIINNKYIRRMRGSQTLGLGDFLKMNWIEENGLRKQLVNGKEMKNIYSTSTMHTADSNWKITCKTHGIIHFRSVLFNFVSALCHSYLLFLNSNFAPEWNNVCVQLL